MIDKIIYVGGRKKCKRWRTRKEKERRNRKKVTQRAAKKIKDYIKGKFENNF
jgi:hypothetical protein